MNKTGMDPSWKRCPISATHFAKGFWLRFPRGGTICSLRVYPLVSGEVGHQRLKSQK